MENNNNQKPVETGDPFYLSDKQYLELKRRDVLLVNWLKAIADKTGVSIDISQLEKIT